MLAKRLLIVLLVVLCLTTTGHDAASYNSVVVYGDSLSDNGNLFSASLGTYPPAPPYYYGRRSNGPVAVEYLADMLGVPLIDYAWIGATTGVGNYADSGTVTSVGLSGLPGMTTMYDETNGLLGPYTAQGLFVVWGGPNDFLAPSPQDDTDYAAIILRALTNELTIIANLKGMGVNTILVPGMPDIGLTPYFQSIGLAAEGTAITDAFNMQLQANLPPGVLYFDTAAMMRDMVTHPADYGFTNVTDPCLAGMCSDPNTYLFYDDFHPTTAAHEILARNFAATVPEPSTIILLYAGYVFLAVFQRRKSR